MVMLGTKWLGSVGISSGVGRACRQREASPVHHIWQQRRGGSARDLGDYTARSVAAEAGLGEHTHVQPLCTALDHALAFSGELAKV